MYEERPTSFDGGMLWLSTPEGDESLILPDGCIDVIWLDGRLVVAGPDAVARTVAAPAGRTVVGLRFAPGQAPSILGVAADELVGQQFDLDDVMSAKVVATLTDTCAESIGPNRVGRALEDAFARRAVETDDPLRSAIVTMSAAGLAVSSVAGRVGLSSRQLQRRSLRLFGYGPKHLAAVLRFQRAVALGRSGAPASAVAVSTGYADQSHLARDARRLTGRSFGELIGGGSGQASSAA